MSYSRGQKEAALCTPAAEGEYQSHGGVILCRGSLTESIERAEPAIWDTAGLTDCSRSLGQFPMSLGRATQQAQKLETYGNLHRR